MKAFLFTIMIAGVVGLALLGRVGRFIGWFK